MKTLYDFGIELASMREALNNIEVRGQQNASLLIYVYEKCNNLIAALNEIGQNLSQSNKEKENDIAEGDVNAE